MFGLFAHLETLAPLPHTGDQVSGFGFFNSGGVDTLKNFIAGFPILTTTDEDEIEAFLLAFDTDLAPMVGQQVTLDASNGGTVGTRITAMITAASTNFVSPAIGTGLNECDLVVSGTVGGVGRGWVYRPGSSDFDDDVGGSITDAALRALATTEGPLTYTCVPPGSGTRMGINRDRDSFLDGNDNCADADNDSQTDTDADQTGDACDQDDDGDALLDVYESDTGSFVSAFDTGTDPLLADTDGDGFEDGFEINAGADPTDAGSVPAIPQVPVLSTPGLMLLGAVLAMTIGLMMRRRASLRG
jgi:hypothetical protein